MTINTDIGISKYIGEGGGEIYFRMLFTRNVILCLRYRYDIGRIQASEGTSAICFKSESIIS